MVFNFKNVAHNHTHYHSTNNIGLLTASIVGDVFLRIIIIIIIIAFTILMVEIMKRKPQMVFSGGLMDSVTQL